MEYTGNAIPAPGFRTGGGVIDDELMFDMNGYSQRGVTLKPGQGVLLLGTLIKQDPTSKQYVKTNGNDAQGVLRQSIDTGTDPNGQVWQGNIVTMGQLKLSKMQAANSGVTLTSVLNARVDTVQGYFKF
ncbi:hypothetical protein SEA_MAGRITTE_20 [Microbacterium phage Magritte]|nr:hypothetical protein SEA_MAGRITTE_20 [Microbacterium phage Magritte]